LFFKLKCTVLFLEEIIKTQNVNTGNTTEIEYKHFKRFVKTKNLYVLFTKANMFLVVKKSSINKVQDKIKFSQFIKSKCINVKW